MDDMSLELTMSFMKSSCSHRFRGNISCRLCRSKPRAGPFQVRLLLTPMPGQFLTNATWHHRNIFMCIHHITIITCLCSSLFWVQSNVPPIRCKSYQTIVKRTCDISPQHPSKSACPAGIRPLAHLNDVWPDRVLRDKPKHMVQTSKETHQGCPKPGSVASNAASTRRPFFNTRLRC